MYGPPQPYPAGQTYPAGQPYPVGQPYGPPGTVVVQPTVFVTRTALTQPASDYLGYSIFTMLCCCLPLGIAALIYSVSVSGFLVRNCLPRPSGVVLMVLSKVGCVHDQLTFCCSLFYFQWSLVF